MKTIALLSIISLLSFAQVTVKAEGNEHNKATKTLNAQILEQSKGKVTVQFNNKFDSKAFITIKDAEGNTLINRAYKGNETYRQNFLTNHLEAGTYTLEIRNKSEVMEFNFQID